MDWGRVSGHQPPNRVEICRNISKFRRSLRPPVVAGTMRSEQMVQLRDEPVRETEMHVEIV